RTTDRTDNTHTGLSSRRMTYLTPGRIPAERMMPCSRPPASSTLTRRTRGSRCRCGATGSTRLTCPWSPAENTATGSVDSSPIREKYRRASFSQPGRGNPFTWWLWLLGSPGARLRELQRLVRDVVELRHVRLREIRRDGQTRVIQLCRPGQREVF